MKKLLLVISIICFSTLNANAASADNVLQSIQIDSFKDTYNIVLKSDEKPEAKRVINDENKMTLTLKGVRASEELNTIYNATNIDSVTVEPTGSDSVSISIKADNVSRSNLVFDTLDTPLGVLRVSDNVKKTSKPKKKIQLSHPMRDYRPVYQDEEVSESFSLDSLTSNEYASSIVALFKDEGITNAISIMLIGLIAFCTVRLFRKNNKDNLQIGLSQSLREREMGLMQDMMSCQNFAQPIDTAPAVRPEMNYGIRTYQNAVRSPYQQHGMRSPYTTSDISLTRPVAPPQQPLRQEMQVGAGLNGVQMKAQATQRPASNSRVSAPQSKVTNVDSMKFLDSMAKIYEKNGRADLAQGLKANINKAKTRV